jgi:hypothetical protein
MLAQLPPNVRAVYAEAFTASLDTVFLVAAVVCAVGFVLSWLLPERPLRTTLAESARDAGTTAAETFARPEDENAVAAQLHSALGVLADRDVQRQHIEQIVRRAGVDLTPLAAWLLVERDRTPHIAPEALGRSRGIPAERVRSALADLRAADLVGPGPAPTLTEAGCDVLERLVTARRAHLAELAADWDPERDVDAASYLRSAVQDHVPHVSRPA